MFAQLCARGFRCNNIEYNININLLDINMNLSVANIITLLMITCEYIQDIAEKITPNYQIKS